MSPSNVCVWNKKKSIAVLFCRVLFVVDLYLKRYITYRLARALELKQKQHQPERMYSFRNHEVQLALALDDCLFHFLFFPFRG